MTREQRLRELVEKWSSAVKSISSYQEGKIDARNKCATDLEAILNEESEGWVFVPIWKMERAASVLENDGEENGVSRDLRDMLKAALTRPADGSDKS